MSKGRFLIAFFILLVVICVVLLTLTSILLKSYIENRDENDVVVKELTQRKDKIIDEFNQIKEKLKVLEEARKELNRSMQEQEEINRLIQEQIKEFRQNRQYIEDKYRESIKDVEGLKSKID